MRKRVVYRLPGQRTDRELVADLLGDYGKELTFSGRPQFGTLTLNRDQVISMEDVDKSIGCYVGKKKT